MALFGKLRAPRAGRGAQAGTVLRPVPLAAYIGLARYACPPADGGRLPLDRRPARKRSPQLKDADGFHRLLAAGVVHQSGDNRIDFSCELYRRYLRGHLAR